MPKFKLSHRDNLEIIALYRQSWPVHAIVRRLAEIGIDVTWGTVKNVIKRYQYGKIGYENFNHKDQNLPKFQYITDQDINFVKTALTENPTRTATDIKHILADKGTHTSKSTVRKVIDAAGFTASKPRYGQMVRDVNKEKRVQFAREVISNDDHFNNVIFTDECSVQLHNNKIVIYREKDSVAPVLPKPKHPLKTYQKKERCQADTSFHMHRLIVLCNLVYLQIKEREIVTCAQSLYMLDQSLQEAMMVKSQKPEWTSVLCEVQGMYYFLCGLLLLKRANKGQLVWKDASSFSVVCFLLSYNFPVINRTSAWYVQSKSVQLQKFYDRVYLFGCYRLSQAGYIASSLLHGEASTQLNTQRQQLRTPQAQR
ncbi:unnamed protein product [Mytilus edulis]|uniref:Transposase Tc1-like domain-containing protein n=1 Tax=Mytilus edulis TaxID=6550 RepID=A0A8S3RGV9_MYTED|nr:unnamed protein product [Mytilus edulis]